MTAPLLSRPPQRASSFGGPASTRCSREARPSLRLASQATDTTTPPPSSRPPPPVAASPVAGDSAAGGAQAAPAGGAAASADAHLHMAPRHSALHHEIEAFCRGVVPNSEELRQRSALVDSIRRHVEKAFPQSRHVSVELLGSAACGLATWRSNINMRVDGLHSFDVAEQEEYDEGRRTAVEASTALLARRLEEGLKPLHSLVLRPRYCTISLVTATGLMAEVCMASPGAGVPAARYLFAAARQYPPMRPLVLVLKTFLCSVAPGGLGGYSLANMVLAHLQEELKAGREIGDLGEVLYRFLVRYGDAFDGGRDAVSVASGGVVLKSSLPAADAGTQAGSRTSARDSAEGRVPRQQRLNLDCPVLGRSMGRAVFRTDRVQDAFASAALKLERLVAAAAEAPSSSDRASPRLLSALFDAEEELIRRHPLEGAEHAAEAAALVGPAPPLHGDAAPAAVSTSAGAATAVFPSPVLIALALLIATSPSRP